MVNVHTQQTGPFDYVIIGGGTAGCVLANRLSTDPKVSVLMLEAGGKDTYPWIHIPVGYLYTMNNPRTDWMMKTAPDPGLNGRVLNYPRGRVLGGCSSINGMIYMRGQSGDYDTWQKMGGDGWGWDDVLPYFLKSEDSFHGKSDMHNVGGEWRVERQRLKWDILEKFRDAADQVGIHPSDDMNTGDNQGSAYFEVNQKRGVRWHTGKGFLKPALGRKNLTVITRALTSKLVLDGKRVTGVDYTHKGQNFRAIVNLEVLLAAGAVNSPKILELSGIGDPEVLKRFDIPVLHALKGVGANLQDHLQIRTVFKVKNAVTLNQKANSIFGKIMMGLEYAFNRSGPLSMAPSQLGLFSKSDAGEKFPNLEWHIQPLSTDKLGDPLHAFPAITASVCNLRPQSRGHIHIQSLDPAVQPKLTMNYLSAERDRAVAAKSIHLTREIMKAPAVAQFEPEEILPGPQHISDEDLVREAGNIASTIFHPVGTCKMGYDNLSVVDARLRVHGIQGLRVVDGSIMPTITSGNTCSPIIMIAEKAADMIIQDHSQDRLKKL
ncbi:MAG: choline dehydrogenase [Rhodospirillaceae bacterium]|nr:MAG: choline dehydrogenase [Rhodospirillaceae bacterium]